MKTIFFIIDKPLVCDVRMQEFLDIVLMAAAFDQRVVLVFEGDGIYALMKDQQAEVLDLKDNSLIFKALSIYDINDVAVEKESMQARAIKTDQLLIPVVATPRHELKQRLQSADQVFSL